MADNSGSFLAFQELLNEIEITKKNTAKTVVIQRFLDNFDGDTYLLMRFLLAKNDKRVYHMRENKFAVILSRLFGCTEQAILDDLEGGNLGATAKKVLVLFPRTKQIKERKRDKERKLQSLLFLFLFSSKVWF